MCQTLIRFVQEGRCVVLKVFTQYIHEPLLDGRYIAELKCLFMVD